MRIRALENFCNKSRLIKFRSRPFKKHCDILERQRDRKGRLRFQDVFHNKIERFKKPPLRLLFVLVAVFINVRYFVWRTSETLVYERFADFIGMMLLYLAELYAGFIPEASPQAAPLGQTTTATTSGALSSSSPASRAGGAKSSST